MDYGYDHPRSVDIDEIRELLRGYGSEESLLKELIQNAEDANAGFLRFVLFDGNSAIQHPLFHQRGLCVINDGQFEPSHLAAMRRLRVGTKGRDAQAIGRFGKGLKSVFAVCEAFFVIAATSKQHWQDERQCHFFNPRSGWRHLSWDRQFSEYRAAITREIEARLQPGLPSSWLALWLPLRHPDHLHDGEHNVRPIFRQERNAAENDNFAHNLVDGLKGLAPSLVTLRNLKTIEVVDRTSGGDAHVTWHAAADGDRPPAPGGPEPRIARGTLALVTTGSRTQIDYIGVSGTQSSDRSESIRLQSDWPETLLIEDDEPVDEKAKGVAHFGVFVTRTPATLGHLSIKWSVFLPVGQQPPGLQEVPVPEFSDDVRITIHGFGFLDPQRTKIDWLDSGFRPKERPTSRACLEWNKLLFEDTALERIPEVLATSAVELGFSPQQCLHFASAFRKLWIWQTFSHAVCRKNRWILRSTAEGLKWGLAPADQPLRRVPRISSREALLDILPGVRRLLDTTYVVESDEAHVVPGLVTDSPTPLAKDEILLVVRGAATSLNNSEGVVDWLNQLLSDHAHSTNLSEHIEQAVMGLCLIPITEEQSALSTYRHVSLADWRDPGVPVYLENSSHTLLAALKRAVPNFRCWLVDELKLPRWLTGVKLAPLSPHAAASIVLCAPLSAVTERIDLAKCLLHASDDETVRAAIRLLMHGHADHAWDDDWLLLPTNSTDAVWERLIHRVISTPPWRVVSNDWSGIFSTNDLADLGVALLNAEGAWSILSDPRTSWGSPVFGEDWGQTEIRRILEGLWSAGVRDVAATKSLLRRLPIHSLTSNPRDRTAIADAQGQLEDSYILDNPSFQRDIDDALQPLWADFLKANHVVRREDSPTAAIIQVQLFSVTEGTDSVVHELNWNHVLRRCVSADSPEQWAGLILHGLEPGHQHLKGIHSLIAETRWLPLTIGTAIAPERVVALPGMDNYLGNLIDPTVDDWVTPQSLPDWVTASPAKNSLAAFFSRGEDALEVISTWCADKPQWRLGLVPAHLPHDRSEFLRHAESLGPLKAAALLAELIRHPVSDSRQPSNSDADRWAALVWSILEKGVCRSFEGDSPAIRQTFSVLLKATANKPKKTVFDAYLKQAVYDGLSDLIPELMFCSKTGEWLPAQKLTWPSAGVEPEFQICEEQANILGHGDVLHSAQAGPDGEFEDKGNRLRSMPDFDQQARDAVAYLRPFADGNAGPEVVAALASVLGGNAILRSFVAELLSRGSRQTPDDFLLELVGERHEWLIAQIRATNFIFEFVAGSTYQAVSVAGEPLEVKLTASIETLLVGDLSHMWRNRFFEYRQESKCHLIRFRAIDNCESLTDPAEVFARTIDGIVFKVYCNGVRSECPVGIAEFLGKLHEGQTDLRRSQLYLLEGAEARILNLGLRNEVAFRAIMRDFDAAREAAVGAEELNPRASHRAAQLRDEAARKRRDANASLETLLKESTNAGQAALVAAIRRKMEQFQYTPDSMLLELFQNADDAAVELSEMHGPAHAGTVFRVSFDANSGELHIVHWGRPINQYLGPGFDGQSRGYHQDLVKMLTLNFSDKSFTQDNQPLIETGKFGLGFKTVFFVSDEPEITSGRLAFRIKGGFFPVPLSTGEIADLRVLSGPRPSPGALPATFVRLRLNPHSIASVGELVRRFRERAPLLTMFAHKVRTIELIHDGRSEIFASEQIALWPKAHLLRSEGGGILLLACPVPGDAHGASVALKIGPTGVLPFPANVPRLWVTTPLSEPSGADLAVNAPFSPDAGRQRVVSSSPENRRILLAVAEGLFAHLQAVAERTIRDWDSFRVSLMLDARVSRYDWWRSMWDVCANRKTIEGNDPISQMAWAAEFGSFRHLVVDYPIVPSELPGQYRALVCPSGVQFDLADVLANIAGPVFATLAEWPTFRERAPVGSLVAPSVLAALREAKLVTNLPVLGMHDVLKWEFGPQLHVLFETAARLSSLIDVCQSPKTGSVSACEFLANLLPKIDARFLTSDGEWQVSRQLVTSAGASGLVDGDELRRAAFAPSSAILHPAYVPGGLRAFVAIRGRLTADAQTLAGWAKQAANSAQRRAVLAYLLEGDLRQELADELGPHWLEVTRATDDWRALPSDEAREVERLFQSLTSIRRHGVPPSPELPAAPEEPEQVMDGDVAFQLISEWWAAEGQHHSRDFTAKTYPENHPRGLPWRSDPGWDAQSHPDARTDWLVLIIDGALVSLGLNRTGRNRKFLTYLIDSGILGDIAHCRSDAQRLVRALDRYLDESSTGVPHHFPMRQFVSFYAASRFLDEYVDALFEINRTIQQNAFTDPFTPARAEILSGTGIHAPALSSFLGMGACQIVRELYRFGRLTNPMGFPQAYCPIRKVRRLFAQLFGAHVGTGRSASLAMYRHLTALATEVGGDATFGRTFDLPLLILAENPAIRVRVLDTAFEAEDSDELEIQDAATAFFAPV